MKTKTVKLIVGLFIILGFLLIGISYAFFSYVYNGEKSEIITGQIYMHYKETKNIYLKNVFPETKEQALLRTSDDSILEFTIDGLNTSVQDIIYDIQISEGEAVEGRTNRIDPKYIRIYLECDGNVVVDGMTYEEWNNKRIHVDTIPAGTTEELVKKYKLRMWVDEFVTISDTDENANYTTDVWNDSYASLLVTVTGNFQDKALASNFIAKKGAYYWPNSIDSVKANITSVNFVKLPQTEIDNRYEAAPIKEDVSDESKNSNVKAWLEPDVDNKYIMYVASSESIYLSEDSSYMFLSFTGLKSISFENAKADSVKNMFGMFYGCTGLTELVFEKFNTSNVTNMSMMFVYCSNLITLDLSCFKTENVTDMSYMFWACNNMKNLILKDFDTRNVTTMYGMFGNLVYINSLDLSSFDTSNTNDMGAMFYECASLTNLDISNFTFNNTLSSNGEYYDGMFTSIPYSAKIYVKSQSEQQWILKLSSDGVFPSGWNENNVLIK